MKIYTCISSLFMGMMMICSVPVLAQTNISRQTEIFSIKGKDTLKIDAYINEKAEVKPEGRPVILYIHGGGFVGGSRINAAQEIYCRYMAERGWLALSVDYRLAGVRQNPDGSINNPYKVDGTLPAIRMACEDVVDATNFILTKKEWKVDATKVVLGGGSAGAFTTLQLIYDACNDEDYTKKLPKDFSYAGGISQAGAIGCSLSQDTLVWKKKPCPLMLFHGDKDPIVPLEKSPKEQTTQLNCNFMGTIYVAHQLNQLGVPCWKWIEKGADHVMAMKPLTNYLEEQYRFLDDFIIKKIQSEINTEVEDATPAGMASVDAMLKYVPFYILGYNKYLDQMDWNKMKKPKSIVY